ncbi:DUF421 domain-containing protein [Hymenobacter aerilatus]|uniref:DUF421 domain-containing protein n=1 Tax=Hymenobacter aerilatus TaxID=2932251 RepID=A0A8T9T424_9BACT|nr:YetF domain-containing protein [Hymenobacter aerilatus]UOR07370.1 DUF421 domain-containing protein [Hymenobacter aerilatus]
MKPEDIHLTDWLRILFGEVPPSFFLEAILRIVFIYLLLVLAMRLMGNRMGSILTRNEMIALVSLAGANGVALMAPDRGLLPVVVAVAIIVGYQQVVAWQAARHEKLETFVLDDFAILVKEGELQLDKLEESVMSREQLLARLRNESIDNLGNVQRVYQEANGGFSFVKFSEPRPGLSILPLRDEQFRQEQPKAPGKYACASCARVVSSDVAPTTACVRCKHTEWQPAVIS